MHGRCDTRAATTLTSPVASLGGLVDGFLIRYAFRAYALYRDFPDFVVVPSWTPSKQETWTRASKRRDCVVHKSTLRRRCSEPDKRIWFVFILINHACEKILNSFVGGELSHWMYSAHYHKNNNNDNNTSPFRIEKKWSTRDVPFSNRIDASQSLARRDCEKETTPPTPRLGKL